MKGMKVRELFRKSSVKISSVVLAAAIVFGGSMYALDYRNSVPELVTFVDTEGSVSIEEDETPLAAPKVTKSTKTSKTTKKIKLKTAAKKTYNQAGKTKTTKKTASSKAGNVSTTTETVTQVSVLNKFKKGSKIQTQVTTTKVTVTKTIVTSAPQATVNTNKTASQTAAVTDPNPAIETIAPLLDSRVIDAYKTLGFKVTVNPSVVYSGLFDARSQMITLKKADDTIYHEVGHFVAFIAGNIDMSQAFLNVYNQEKSLYTAYNRDYVLSSPSEYFAESFKNYTMNPAGLKAERPATYAAITAALNNITPAQVQRIGMVYGAIWNK